MTVRRWLACSPTVLILSILTTGGAIAQGPYGSKVKLAGTGSNELACVSQRIPLPVSFAPVAENLPTREVCIEDLLAELEKKKPGPALPVGSGLTWFLELGGLEFRVESAAPALPLTDRVVQLPFARPWAYYVWPHVSEAGKETQLVATTSSGSASNAPSAVAPAAGVAKTSAVSPDLVVDLASMSGGWTLTALTGTGEIDQLITCARTGQIKMMNTARASVPNPAALVLLPGVPRQLSAGQRQRVGLARALVMQPTILLMDECLEPLTHEIDVSGLRTSPGRNPIR